MKLTKIIATASVATLLATSVFAQDIAVIAGSIEDAFMDKIKKGVDDATHMVEANGGSVNYLRTQNYENFGPDLVTLINQAVAQGVDGIAIPVWVPHKSPRCKKRLLLASRSCSIIPACQSKMRSARSTILAPTNMRPVSAAVNIWPSRA